MPNCIAKKGTHETHFAEADAGVGRRVVGLCGGGAVSDRQASKREWDRQQAAAFVRAGLTTRGTVRKYRRWAMPGTTRRFRERTARRYCLVSDLCERLASVLARSQEWLPGGIRKETVELCRHLARIKKNQPAAASADRLSLGQNKPNAMHKFKTHEPPESAGRYIGMVVPLGEYCARCGESHGSHRIYGAPWCDRLPKPMQPGLMRKIARWLKVVKSKMMLNDQAQAQPGAAVVERKGKYE